MPLNIRPAFAEDVEVIKTLVRQARINPRNLDWHHFLVAEDVGRIVGAGQVKQYPDGTRELASLVVLPEYRGRGVSGQIVELLLAGESGPLYVILDEPYAGSYAKYGFVPIPPSELPKDLAREFRIGRIVTTIGSWFLRRRIRIVPLKRKATPEKSM